MKTHQPKRKNKLNNRTGQPASRQSHNGPQTGFGDWSGGARGNSSPPELLCPGKEIREDYVELNPGKKMAWARVFLPALARRYAECPWGRIEGVITVLLHRRGDGQPAEVDLEIQHVEADGKLLMLLHRVAERPLAEVR